ncbi:MAG: DUF3558 family protein [Candidatus Limnocylindrales bacterium]
MRRTLILLAFATGLVAACSGSAATGAPQAPGTQAGATQAAATEAAATGATDTAAAGAPKALDACSLITTDEAAAALGEPVDPGTVPTAGSSSCLFSGHPATGIDISGVEISITSGGDFNPNKKSISGLTITPVSGVGDAAYYVSIGAGYQVLNVQKGQTTFTVSVLKTNASDSQLQSAEKTLALAILGRI